MLEKEKRMTVAELQALISKYLEEGVITPESPVIWDADEFGEYGFFESPKLWDMHSYAYKIIPFRYKHELDIIEDSIQWDKEKLKSGKHDRVLLEKKIAKLETEKENLEQFKGGLVLGTI